MAVQEANTLSSARLSFIDSAFSTKADWLAARQSAAAARQPASQPASLGAEAPSSASCREPHSTPGWTEVFLNAAEAGACSTAGASVAAGHSLIVVSSIASAAECETFLTEVQAFHERTRTLRPEPPHWPTNRIPTDRLGARTQALCNEVLLRALELVDSGFPEFSRAGFGGSVAASLRSQGKHCVDDPTLDFNRNEPAVNIYNPGNGFAPHKDMHALTVLMPLVGEQSFSGGGTAFWSAPAPDAPYFGATHTWEGGTRRTVRGSGALPDVETVPPHTVLRHPAGTAILFGGDVVHAGAEVASGQRVVLVASFSRRGVEPLPEGSAVGRPGSLAEARRRAAWRLDQERMKEHAT